LLCSDGLFKTLDPDEIKTVLASEVEPQRSADRLVANAVEREAEDNVTAMITDIH
jgi:protein phosphatase